MILGVCNLIKGENLKREAHIEETLNELENSDEIDKEKLMGCLGAMSYYQNFCSGRKYDGYMERFLMLKNKIKEIVVA